MVLISDTSTCLLASEQKGSVKQQVFLLALRPCKHAGAWPHRAVSFVGMMMSENCEPAGMDSAGSVSVHSTQLQAKCAKVIMMI